jgi:hypothetical protein
MGDIEVERQNLMEKIEQFYFKLTGSQCRAQIFVVRRDSLRGCYYVQRLGSGDFYEVNIKRG